VSAEAETPELLSCYLAFIGRGPLLTRREEVILGRRVRSGDRRGRRKLRLEPIVRSTPRLSSCPRGLNRAANSRRTADRAAPTGPQPRPLLSESFLTI
jgi:hypothetical protein